MNDYKFSIIIPTKNRLNLVKNLVSKIDTNLNNLLQVIIVDSSDKNNSYHFLKKPKIKYIHTKHKSAAIQRNIGIESLSKNAEFIFFLDDDVEIQKSYFDDLMQDIIINEAIGASGLAINSAIEFSRLPPKGAIGAIKRLFLLDSKIEGKLLRSAVNIPCRKNQESESNIKQVDWLIGCAAWKKEIIERIKFEETFQGQSIGEDVLFSNKARKFGKIIVDKTVILDHAESKIERPNEYEFYKMWVINRNFISKQLRLSPLNLASHWSNLGKIIHIIFSQKKNKIRAISGILDGYRVLIRLNQNEN